MHTRLAVFLELPDQLARARKDGKRYTERLRQRTDHDDVRFSELSVT
jgi:hypothetical protein